MHPYPDYALCCDGHRQIDNCRYGTAELRGDRRAIVMLLFLAKDGLDRIISRTIHRSKILQLLMKMTKNDPLHGTSRRRNGGSSHQRCSDAENKSAQSAQHVSETLPHTAPVQRRSEHSSMTFFV